MRDLLKPSSTQNPPSALFVLKAEKLKKEMEEMRESLFSENASLKEERSQTHRQIDELKQAVAQRDGTISALITQV